MDCLKSTDIVLDQIRIADWYDGLVVATGGQQLKAYLIMLVAWDLVRSRKAFLLLEIERSVEGEIHRSLQNNGWEEFKKIFAEVVTNYNGAAFLTFDEPTVGKPLSISRISSNHLRGLKNHDLESTVTFESVQRWLGSTEF